MIVGYVLDHILGLILSLLVVFTNDRSHPSRFRTLTRSLKAFQSCAIFLAFSIEIAAIVVLVKEDFGVDTRELGDFTARITHAVAMLVLLALVYVILAGGARKPDTKHAPMQPVLYSASAQHFVGQGSDSFVLIVLCWALSFYPFYSRMNAAFGPSKISNKPGSAIDTNQFGRIRGVCFDGVQQISGSEDHLMSAVIVLTYIPLSLYILTRIVWLGVERNHADSAFHNRLVIIRDAMPPAAVTTASFVGFALVPVLACGLLWSIVRVRSAQQALTAYINSTDSDGAWTFGQIVAVTVFAPVLVECWISVGAERASSSSRIDAHGAEKMDRSA